MLLAMCASLRLISNVGVMRHYRTLSRDPLRLFRRVGHKSTYICLDRPLRGGGCVGSEEARDLTITLASVRRSNCTDGFPVYSFHDDALPRGVIEGIKAIKFTNPYSPYSFVLGSCRQPVFRQRLDRCDRSRRTIQLSSRLKSFRM